MSLEIDVQKLAPGAKVDLYEIDLTKWGLGISRYHNGINALGNNIVWQGNTYVRFPIKVTGYEKRSGGTLPRPTLSVSNIEGVVSSLCKLTNNLTGAKVTRKRTLVKYLDAVNVERLNWFIWSEDILNAAYVANKVTKNTSEKFTVTALSTPYIRQIVSGLGNVSHRTFSFSMDVKTDAAFVGRVLHSQISVYPSGAYFSSGNTPALTTSYQTVSRTVYLPGSYTDTSIAIFLTCPGTWGIGDFAYTTKWQINEGTVLNPYQFTNASWAPDADPNTHFEDEIYNIDRKSHEGDSHVEFELATAWDVSGVMLPRRQVIANVCPHEYRGEGCNYAGGAVAKYDDTPTTDINEDRCGHRISSCKLRFPTTGARVSLPFGGFPGAGLFK